jgi:hypothetical protein
LNHIRAWAEQSPRHAEMIARSLSYLYPDANERRKRLLSLLEDPMRIEPDECLLALLDEGVRDPEQLIEPALMNVDKLHYYTAENVRHIIIKAFPSDTRARQATRHLLSEPSALFPTVLASVYENDREFRPIILRAAGGASTEMRRLVADCLARRSVPPEVALPVLSEFLHEDDAVARASAAVGVATHTVAAGKPTDLLTATLVEEATCIGPELHERRPAGVAGLVAEGRIVELVSHIKSKTYGNPLEQVLEAWHPNPPALRALLRAWPPLKQVAGDALGPTVGLNEHAFWEAAAPWLDEFPELRETFDEYVMRVRGQPVGASVLTAIADLMPRGDLLRRSCLAALGAREHHRPHPSWTTAARLLGIHFAGDEAALNDLLKIEGSIDHWGVTLALCWGWPTSDILLTRAEQLLDHPIPWVLHLHLARVLARPETMLGVAENFLAACIRGAAYPRPDEIQAVCLSIQDSDMLRSGIETWLTREADFAATGASLLRACGLISADVRRKLQELLDREAGSETPPRVGYDLISGRRRPVAEAAYAALSSVS